jgi:hypothetical protein
MVGRRSQHHAIHDSLSIIRVSDETIAPSSDTCVNFARTPLPRLGHICKQHRDKQFNEYRKRTYKTLYKFCQNLVQSGTTIRHYDKQPLFGLDIAGVLMGTTTYDQVETYLQFAPVKMWRRSPTGKEPTLVAAIHEAVELTCSSRAFAFCDTSGPHTYCIETCRKMVSRLSLQLTFRH